MQAHPRFLRLMASSSDLSLSSLRSWRSPGAGDLVDLRSGLESLVPSAAAELDSPSLQGLASALRAVSARRAELEMDVRVLGLMGDAVGGQVVGSRAVLGVASSGPVRFAAQSPCSGGSGSSALGGVPPVRSEIPRTLPVAEAENSEAAQLLLLGLASVGLGGKLYLSVIPEVLELGSSLERLLPGAAADDAESLTRAWLLLRGVRGLHGVRWLCEWMGRHRDMWQTTWSSECVGRLLSDFHAHSAAAHGGDLGWASHREGRHAALSGYHFLRALASPLGFTLAVQVSERLHPLLRRLLAGDGSVGSDIFVDVALELQGSLLLAVDPVRRIGPYNSMDFARGLAAWAHHSGRLRLGLVSERLWSFFLQRQHRDAAAASVSFSAATFFNLGTAAQANDFLRALSSAALPLQPGGSFPASVTWVGLLVFLCETRQVLRDSALGFSAVRRVLATPRAVWLSAAVQTQASLLRNGSSGRGCYLGRLLRACLDASSRHDQRRA